MIVGITGRAGAGKDTVADYLVDTYGFGKTSFAGPIKDMINTLLGEQPEAWEDREWKETPILCGKSPRYLAQTLGTEWGRRIVGEDIWVRLALDASNDFEHLVISDVRFDNEAEAIHEAGGYIIQVCRNNTLTQLTEHASERGVDPRLIDWAVFNEHDFDHMYGQLDVFLEAYNIGRRIFG
jgi:hypothetical protein